MFGDRKSSDTFLEIGKNLSKMVRSNQFFKFITNNGSNGAQPAKMSTIGLKLPIWCPKQCSVVEKVKPHRVRSVFVTGSMCCSNYCKNETKSSNCVFRANQKEN